MSYARSKNLTTDVLTIASMIGVRRGSTDRR
jgi:hypothetical protein